MPFERTCYTTTKTVLTGFMRSKDQESDAMCHCFGAVDEMSENERTELREEHTTEELQAEYSSDELEQLGVAA